ncbi:MAG: LPS-assembly protein LptD [Brevundimonas sp.]|uniref:LPS-assembly protein LptD n=1 Tax=Brevundimonas sp. TaxID=1871086 RepID=UPI003918CAD9
MAQRRLLGGAAALALIPTGAIAQQTPANAVPTGAVYIEADDVVRDADTGQVAARGDEERVLARFEGRNLRGREVTYNLNTGVAAASGDVELIDIDGTVVTADLLELDENLQTGVAVNLAVRATDGSHLMAATAVRRSQTVNELNYALFTPCPICDENGPREPTWSIQAQTVVQDEDLRAILYRNALFRVGGLPVLWLPFFAHPDPTVERASGFLVPGIDYDEARGFSYEQPYLIVVSPSEDWIVSPQFNTDVNPFLNVQWRRHFGVGVVEARAGYTYEDIPGVEERDHRGYLLAHGAFDPAGPWRWGFTAERASDKTLFDRYGTDDPYQDNGLYYGDRRRLISQVYAERQTERSYLSAAAFSIQSLRVLEVDRANPANNVFERDGVTPVAAPVIEAMWEPRQGVMGGRLRLTGNAAVLIRENYVGAPVLSPGEIPAPDPSDPTLAGYPGVDSARLVVTADWRRVLTSPIGLRWEPFFNLRADAYAVENLPSSPDDSVTITRARATAGLDVSYPLIRRFENGADLVLEPLAQISISSRPDLDPRLPNEDSQVTDLDETSLFAIDRFTGHDLYEGGLRLTAGGRASLRWGSQRSASVFLGRSWRDEAEDRYLVPTGDGTGTLFDPSGLADRASDWVVAATFSPGSQVRGWAHAQIDDGGEVRRAEIMVDGEWGARNMATVSYIIDRSNPGDVDPDLPLATRTYRNYEFVQFSGQQFISGNWGVAGRGIMDLQEDRFTRSEVGVLFEDDCIRFEIGYRRDNTRVDPSGPRTGAYVRLTLATLGGTGYQRDDMW